jgi:heterodisulfide reductase subunit A
MVFVCHCGRNIGGVADVPAVRDYAAGLADVVYADDNLYTCSSDTQEHIKEMIREHALNRVVVASCTPRTHERLFRNTCREAGLNPYLFEMANIRDRDTWVHMREPDKATHKAKDLVRMAVAKARLLEPLQNRFLAVEHEALVIGGGLAGMSAALQLADQGFHTHLVERSEQLGGNTRRIQSLLDGGCEPQQELASLVARTRSHPQIAVYTSAHIAAVEGSVGNFQTTIQSPERELTLRHGAILVATGGAEYLPGEYLYGEDPKVLTQLEFEQALAGFVPEPSTGEAGPGPPGDLDGVAAVAMIQCVGSRDDERPYCSRICCSTAIKNALNVKEVKPDTEVYVLYRDLRAYGFKEEHYRRAREKGVVFLQYDKDAEPEVVRSNGRLTITVDERVLGRRVALPADLVVLSAGIVPEAGNEDLAQQLKVPLGQEKYFLEAHMKLRPVDFATDGIFLCGLAHSPQGVKESLAQAGAATSRAATILAKEEIELDAVVSRVIDENCDGCAYCIDPCPYHALTLIEYMRNGVVKKTVDRDIAVCKGCGVCQATCPKEGIAVDNFKMSQLTAMIDAALEAS